MLHWLSGQKTHENAGGGLFIAAHESAPLLLTRTDANTTVTEVDQPETPAHTFAIRAFRHAIYGTPNTVQPKPRRRSNDPTRATRPRIVRPKSTNDAQTIGSLDVAIGDDVGLSPLPSPTKGILLTPGTATTRRKTVSFGDHVIDNEGKRPMKSGLPDDCPGKFPSPWEKSFVDLDLDQATEKPKGRNKLNEALEQVRDESAKRKSKTTKHRRSKEDADLTADLSEPQSESGRYWKQEYDIYRERTTNEVRKLVEKNRLAKRYAREKDTECTDLREDIRREQRNSERLEKRVAELEAQLKELQNKSFDGKLTKPDTLRSFDLPRRDSATADTEERSGREVSQPSLDKHPRSEWRARQHIATQQIQHERSELGDSKPLAKQTDAVAAPTLQVSQEASGPIRDTPRPKHRRARSEDNSRARSSVQTNTGTGDDPDTGTALCQQSTDNTAALRSIDINTATNDTHSVALSMGMQPPSPVREHRHESPLRSPMLFPSSPILYSRSPPRSYSPMKPAEHPRGGRAIPDSSPFQPDTVSERPNVLTGALVPMQPTMRPGNKRVDTKENEKPPHRPPRSPIDEQQKPSAAWQAMSAPASESAPVDTTSVNDLSQNRLAAAKARLASKGRIVS